MEGTEFVNVTTQTECTVRVMAELAEPVLLPRSDRDFPWFRADKIEVSFCSGPSLRTRMVRVWGAVLYASKNPVSMSYELWFDNGEGVDMIGGAPQWVRDFLREHTPPNWED